MARGYPAQINVGSGVLASSAPAIITDGQAFGNFPATFNDPYTNAAFGVTAILDTNSQPILDTSGGFILGA